MGAVDVFATRAVEHDLLDPLYNHVPFVSKLGMATNAPIRMSKSRRASRV